jgi:RNA polymerase sigma-70 factor (ECF subfamily)
MDSNTLTVADSNLRPEGPIDPIRQAEATDLGSMLEALRPYLLAIANAELPQALAGKLGASDLAQWTITQAYHQFADFRGTTSADLAGWMRQILVNHLKSVQRSYASEKRNCFREQSADDNLVDQRQLTPSGAALSNEEWNLLNGALAKLPEDYRQAVNLRNVENLSFVEMGQRLNRSEEAARKLWARAIKLLQQELGTDDCQRYPSGSERT